MNCFKLPCIRHTPTSRHNLRTRVESTCSQPERCLHTQRTIHYCTCSLPHSSCKPHTYRYSQFELTAGGTNCLSVGTLLLLFMLIFSPSPQLLSFPRLIFTLHLPCTLISSCSIFFCSPTSNLYFWLPILTSLFFSSSKTREGCIYNLLCPG